MTTRARNTAPLSSLGERGAIGLIRERFPASPTRLTVGIGDDAAVAVPERGALEILTTDALVEGVHFDLAYSTLGDVGHKAIAVNVSDIASMGGTPRLALLSLMLPAWVTVGDLEDLLDGIASMAREVDVTLAGGNMTRSPGPLIVDVTLTGAARPRRFLTRAGGKPGDSLYVTGAVGAAAAGLGWLRARSSCDPADSDDPGLAECVRRHRRPEPRARLGSILGRTRTASACMDLSDGLADAVRQIASSSGTGARIDANSLPIPAAARRFFEASALDPVSEALTRGDDYELLFALPPRRKGRLKTVVQQSRGVPITRIGELTAAPPIVLVRNGMDEPIPEGFTHF